MHSRFFIYFLLCSALWMFVSAKNSTSTRMMKNKFIPKKSICGLNELCAKVPRYPKMAIRRLINRNKNKFEYLSGPVILPADETGIIVKEPGIDENICRTKKVSVIPKAAFDIKKRLKYIVNVEEFKQVITYETCRDDGKGCYGHEHWPNDFQTFCKQSYTVIRLLSVSHLGKMEYAYFQIPTNCICAYRKLTKSGYE